MHQTTTENRITWFARSVKQNCERCSVNGSSSGRSSIVSIHIFIWIILLICLLFRNELLRWIFGFNSWWSCWRWLEKFRNKFKFLLIQTHILVWNFKTLLGHSDRTFSFRTLISVTSSDRLRHEIGYENVQLTTRNYCLLVSPIPKAQPTVVPLGDFHWLALRCRAQYDD